MEVENLYFKNINELKKSLDLSSIDTDKTLLQVYSGLIKELELKELVDVLKEKNDKAKFIGATTAGEIYNGQIGSSGIGLSIMKFNDTKVNTSYFINEDELALGQDIANEMFEPNTKAMILFVDGLLTNGSNVIDGIASVNSNIPIAGGMAGDNGNFIATFVFNQNGVYNKGAVAATLQSDNLDVYTDYQLNWQPIGKTMTVTKAEGTRLYELDGVCVSDVYTKYLGKNIGENLPHSAIEFPLIKLDENGLEVCRTFVHRFEDGSLQTIGNIFEGDKVKFSFGNINLAIDATEEKTKELYKYYPEAIFTYSCASRITFMQSEVVRELEPLNRIAPISGFFTYGEIFHKNGKNHLLNISLTLLMLSERKAKKDIQPKQQEEITTKAIEEKNFFKGKHFLVLDALTNLTRQVISELNESKDEIDEINKHTRESIEYASLIQHTLIPSNEIFNKYFNDYLTLWNPKDIVGGDIYLFEELRDKNECLLMVIDCTGHGVPGAFVTMLVKAIERQIISEINNSDEEISPAKILGYFNKTMKKLLKQEDESSVSNAGFDGGILYYNKKEKIIKFAGAETALFYIDENEHLQTIKGNRHSIGYKKSDANYEFKEHLLEVKEGMQFYITTDGYLDQNGGEKGFPFGKRKFKTIIKENYTKSLSDQKESFIQDLVDYQGKEERNDDITVVCVKI